MMPGSETAQDDDLPEFEDLLDEESATDDGSDVQHYPEGFTSGPSTGRVDDMDRADRVPLEDRCADCSNEAPALRCGCCGMPLCGKHHELGGGFCSRFFETDHRACVWGDEVYVFDRPAREVLVTDELRSDVFHLLADEGDDDCTNPLCRPVEDGKDRVEMSELGEDFELCSLCEDRVIELADEGDDDGGDA